jgi:hypothetical protein
MLKKIISLVSAVILLGAVTEAFAQEGGYTKKKVFSFQGDDIEGSLLSPSGQFLGGDLKVDFKTLIEYRYDFVPEMVKSAEDV